MSYTFRNNNSNSYSNFNSDDIGAAGFVIQGDRDEDLALQQRQHDAASEILTAMGGMLQGADSGLCHLEENIDLLPSAILRKCRELADGIGIVATRLEEHSPEEQRCLAQACAQDFTQTMDAKHSLALQSNDDLLSSDDMAIIASIPTEDQFLRAIQGASTLLRDVEAAFREISEEDAEDIADAALTLARLFLLSLQNVHQTLTPHDLMEQKAMTSSSSRSSGQSSSIVIEELDEEGESKAPSFETTEGRKPARRVRVLWPPMGPHVADALNWGKEAAAQRPLLAVALGLALWPAAVVTTCVGGSLVLADSVVQDIYQHFQDGPLVSNLEQSAAQLFQAAKLSFVLSCVVGKQTWRVVQRQVKRNGGVEQIAHSITEAALDRVTHPIETVGIAWNGLTWSISTVTATVQQILQQREELLASQALQ